jgi:DNA-binding GntR family transcriptional regulator
MGCNVYKIKIRENQLDSRLSTVYRLQKMNGDAKMKKVTTVPSYAVQVGQMLKKSILSGGYAPGARLNEAELAESMGVSRSPIREAIQRLAKEGLVELIPRKGSFVTSLKLNEVEELFELREVLEIKAAELAAQRISDEELNQLSKLLDNTTDMIKRKKYRQYPWNLDFHKQIASCAKNRYLFEKIYDTNVHLLLVRHKSGLEIGRADKALQEHRKIFEAIKNKNADLAGKFMKEHIRLSRENITLILSK